MQALRGCVLGLLVYLALGAGVAYAVERRVEHRKAALIAGGVGGLILFIGMGHLLNVGRRTRELMVIRRGQAEGEPEDGKMFAAIGPITATGGQRLSSPLTRTSALAYTYSIIASSTQKWDGEALVPSSIRSGVHSIRLLGLGTLDFRPEIVTGESAARNARDYITNCTFESVEKEDGSVHRDRGPRAQNPNLRYAVFAERVIRQGDNICAFGKYSTVRRGLVVEKLEKADSLIFPRVRAIGSGLMNFAAFTAVVAAAFTVFFALVPLDEKQPSTIEMRIEDLLEERVRQPIARAGAITLPLFAVGDGLRPFEARGRVKTAHGEAVVTRAEGRHTDDGLIVFFEDGTRSIGFVELNSSGELRRLHALGEDLPAPGESLSAQVTNELITGRLTWAKHDAPAVHVVFSAGMVK